MWHEIKTERVLPVNSEVVVPLGLFVFNMLQWELRRSWQPDPDLNFTPFLSAWEGLGNTNSLLAHSASLKWNNFFFSPPFMKHFRFFCLKHCSVFLFVFSIFIHEARANIFDFFLFYFDDIIIINIMRYTEEAIALMNCSVQLYDKICCNQI